MALGSTQPLIEISTRSISWGWRRPVRKADNLPPSCAFVTKSGNLNFLEPSGPLQACNGTALPYIYIYIYISKDCLFFFTQKLSVAPAPIHLPFPETCTLKLVSQPQDNNAVSLFVTTLLCTTGWRADVMFCFITYTNCIAITHRCNLSNSNPSARAHCGGHEPSSHAQVKFRCS